MALTLEIFAGVSIEAPAGSPDEKLGAWRSLPERTLELAFHVHLFQEHSSGG